MNIIKNDKGQAVATPTRLMTSDDFKHDSMTRIYWMGNASIMIHSHDTNIMIDPLLEGFDMPLLIDMPIKTSDVPNLDGILITHIDNDHCSEQTLGKLKHKCKSIHGPKFVASQMEKLLKVTTQGHDILDKFNINHLSIQLTPAWHNWQNDYTKYNYRYWEMKDYCGYYIHTPDGSIYLPGDSKLLDAQLNYPEPDVILFDFSDNEWHITLEGAIKLANNYPNSKLVCIHWGSVDAPNMSPFNGNPEVLFSRIVHKERIVVLAPGEYINL